MLLLVLLIWPWEMLASLLMGPLIFLLELSFWGMLPRVFRNYPWTNICIMLTHMISWVLLLGVWPSLGFPSICLLTLRDPRLGFFCPLMCRYEDMGWRTCACGTWSFVWCDQDLMVLYTHCDGLQEACALLWRLHTLCELSYTLIPCTFMFSYLRYEIVIHLLTCNVLYLYHAFISSLACFILYIICHASFVYILVD